MWVVFNDNKIMHCFYDTEKEQWELMHRDDIDKQVKEWQRSNTGQPPKFHSRIKINEFISDGEAMRRNITYK